MQKTDEARAEGMIPLALLIMAAEGAVPSPTNVLIDVVFKNVSDKNLRVLEHFKEEENLSIWFEVQLWSPDGTPLLGAIGGGKINLRGQLEYQVLKPGEKFTLRLNAARFFETGIPPGIYHANVIYRNQYGTDCFKGQVKSNTLVFTIPTRDQRDQAPGRQP